MTTRTPPASPNGRTSPSTTTTAPAAPGMREADVRCLGRRSLLLRRIHLEERQVGTQRTRVRRQGMRPLRGQERHSLRELLAAGEVVVPPLRARLICDSLLLLQLLRLEHALSHRGG